MERKYFSGSFCQSCVHGNESRLVQYPAGNKLTAFHRFSIQNPGSPKCFFSALRASVWSKNKEGGPGPPTPPLDPPLFSYKADHFQRQREASLLHFLQNVKSFTHESRLKCLTKPKCVKLSDFTCPYLRLDESKMSTSIAEKSQYDYNNSFKRGSCALSVAFTR